MTDRRRQYDQSPPAHYHRILDRIDAIGERWETKFDHLDTRLMRMEKDIAEGRLDRDLLSRDIAEVRRDFGEVRDGMAIADGRRTAAAAEGAAKGAATVAATVSEAVAKDGVSKSTWVRFTAAAAGLVAIMSVLNNIPDVARGWDKVWKAIKNEDAVAAAPHKQDTTDGK